MTNHFQRLFLLFLSLEILVGCQPSARAYLEEGEELSGGQATVFDETPNAFSLPMPGLEGEKELLFFVGNSFFNQNWVTAPASTTARDGLGPLFNSRSCAGCHFKDGRGRPPEFMGETPTGFLVRLSRMGEGLHGSPLSDEVYGGQLQPSAIANVPAEARVTIVYQERAGTFPDGTPYSLHYPTYQLDNWAYGQPPTDLLLSPRVANQMIGLGLLEAIPETTILALADEDDRNGDGISGRANQVWDVVNQQTVLGRFGWKANAPHLLQQTAAAFLGDMGITTSLFPNQNCTVTQTACALASDGGQPEIAEDDLQKVVLYASSLAVPARRQWDDPQVLQGKKQFMELGCNNCHIPTLQTGEHPTLPALSHQTIHPYTDLLLHDMGPDLADGRPDFLATGREWRTPPLWGIGLIETVNGHSYYLHDGRARNLTEAILWHGGEAEQAKQLFMHLLPTQRDALIRFLLSL